MRKTLRFLFVSALLVALPAVAVAEVFTITLANGNSFTSRYRPKTAGWDADKALLLTDQGNWISLAKTDIASVVVETEVRGFGKVIDTTTISLGVTPNDAAQAESALGAGGDPMDRLLSYLQGQQGDRPNYSVNQFVDPSEAGATPSGGLPAYFGGGGQSVGGTAFPGSGGFGGGVPVGVPGEIDE